jgi:hypothetical protein
VAVAHAAITANDATPTEYPIPDRIVPLPSPTKTPQPS